MCRIFLLGAHPAGEIPGKSATPTTRVPIITCVSMLSPCGSYCIAASVIRHSVCVSREFWGPLETPRLRARGGDWDGRLKNTGQLQIYSLATGATTTTSWIAGHTHSHYLQRKSTMTLAVQRLPTANGGWPKATPPPPYTHKWLPPVYPSSE